MRYEQGDFGGGLGVFIFFILLIWKYVVPIALMSLSGLFLKRKLLPRIGPHDAAIVSLSVLAYLALWHQGVFSGMHDVGWFYDFLFPCAAGGLVLGAIREERKTAAHIKAKVHQTPPV